MEIHEIALCWPAIKGDAFSQLVESIRIQGLIDPIVTYEDKILDGRNRFLACLEAGIEPRYVPYEGNDPIGFCVAKNNSRRHQTLAQRVIVAARLAKAFGGVGTNQYTPQDDVGSKEPMSGDMSKLSTAKAAKHMEVSPSSVARGKIILDKGTPELIQDVAEGKISIAKAVESVSGNILAGHGTVSDTVVATPTQDVPPLTAGDVDWSKIPVRTEITVFGPDDPNARTIGLPMGYIDSDREAVSLVPDQAFVEQLQDTIGKLEAEVNLWKDKHLSYLETENSQLASLKASYAALETECAELEQQLNIWKNRAETAMQIGTSLTDAQIAYGRDVVAPRIEARLAESQQAETKPVVQSTEITDEEIEDWSNLV